MPVFSTTILDLTCDETPGLQDNDVTLATASATTARVASAGYTATPTAAATRQVMSYTAAPSSTPSFSLNMANSLSALASGLFTTSGYAVTLELVAPDLIIGTYMVGATKAVAFALMLAPVAPAGGSFGGLDVTTVEYTPLAHLDAADADDSLDLAGLVFLNIGGEIAFNDFSAAPAGQNVWTSVAKGPVQILVTGLDLGVDTVNTRNTSLGSNNQAVDPGEGLVFDFVTGQTAPTSTSAKSLSGIDFTDRHEGTTGGFTILQTGGGAKTRVSTQVTAYDSEEMGGAGGGAYGDGTIDLAGNTSAINSVTVYSGSTAVRTWTWDGTTATESGSDTAVHVTRSGDAVTVSGLLVNYRVSFGVESGDVLDRFSVVNAGTKPFDLGDIRIGSAIGEQAALGDHLHFDDDGPSAIEPVAATVTNGPGAAATFNLDDGVVGGQAAAFAANYGQDGAGTVTFAATGPSTLLDTNGDAVTSGGTAITLEGWGQGTLTARAGTSGPIVFTVTLDASGTYTVDMEGSIDNGAISFSNFGSGGAGLRYWLGVAGTQDAAKDLLVTATTPGATPVNNDSDDIAAANQWIDKNETVRLDFVSGITTTSGTSSLSDIPVAVHYNVNDVGFTVMQGKGAAAGVDVTIMAIDAARDIAGADAAADLVAGTRDVITSVTVVDGSTGLSTTYLRGGSDAKVVFLAEGVIVNDINAPSTSTRDQVFVSTSSGFDRLEVTNTDASKQNAFAIGGFEIGAQAGDPAVLQFAVDIADGDGDSAVGLIGVTIDP